MDFFENGPLYTQNEKFPVTKRNVTRVKIITIIQLYIRVRKYFLFLYLFDFVLYLCIQSYTVPLVNHFVEPDNKVSLTTD